MFQIITTVTLISLITLGILIGMYRLYEERVAEPRKLEDELRDALDGQKPDVSALEPVRKAAAAIAYRFDKIVVIRNFDKVSRYHIRDLVGIELFADDQLLARVLRYGPNKTLDDISAQINRVTMRLVFDDPTAPDFELVLWDPHDAGTARAEGPRAAMETARRWYYHVEAILRRPVDVVQPIQPIAPGPVPTPPMPEPERALASAPRVEAPASLASTEGDILNAPIIPYL